jgi:hypothetical protein
MVIFVISSFIYSACSKLTSESLDTNKQANSKKNNKFIVNFKDSFWEVYGGKEVLAIKSIEESSDVSGRLVLRLQHNFKNFSHFLISKNGAESEKNIEGAIFADFDINSVDPEKVKFKINIVAEDGKISQPYFIKLIGNSRKYWSSRGAMGYPNWVTVKTNPYINFIPKYKVEDWIYKNPKKEEITFARSKWGKLIQEVESNYEKAKILAKTLLDDLIPHIGTPSDSMYTNPFVQYERMVSGRDKGFCSNFAHIFIQACNSFGIPARRIHLQKVHSKSENPDELSVRMDGMHSTVEIFDNKLNQWILMDYYSNALGFYLDNLGPLNAIEFGLFLNKPDRKKYLKILYYNRKTKEEKMIPISENPKTQYASFDGKDTEYHFFIKK